MYLKITLSTKSLMSIPFTRLIQAPWPHKVSPQSTDSVPLHSMYSKLQNVNIRLLDSRLGPTPSSLVAEKGKSSNQLLFYHNNKVKLILGSRLILKSRPPDLSPGLDTFFLLPNRTEWALVYCPETLCLNSTDCRTYCTKDLAQ